MTGTFHVNIEEKSFGKAIEAAGPLRSTSMRTRTIAAHPWRLIAPANDKGSHCFLWLGSDSSQGLY